MIITAITAVFAPPPPFDRGGLYGLFARLKQIQYCFAVLSEQPTKSPISFGFLPAFQCGFIWIASGKLNRPVCVADTL